jgi:hypothetical protein
VLAILHLSMLAALARFDRAVTHDELVREKHGRVVDASSGSGLKDVAVFAIWDVQYQNLHSSGSGCIFEKIVWTDAQGEYVVPDTSQEFDAFLKRAGASAADGAAAPKPDEVAYGWRIVVYKNGFLRKGDLEKFGPKRSYAASLGFQVGFEWQGGFLPEVQHIGDYVGMAPISMVKADPLSSTDELTYLSRIRQATLCRQESDPVDSPAHDRVTQALAARTRTLACELPSDLEMSGEDALEAIQLMGGKAAFASMHRAGEPTMPPWHAIAAKVLCDVAGTPLDPP